MSEHSVWKYRPGELAAFHEAIMSRSPHLLRSLIANAIAHGAEPQAVTEHVVDVLRDDADDLTKQWWSDHGHDANDG